MKQKKMLIFVWEKQIYLFAFFTKLFLVVQINWYKTLNQGIVSRCRCGSGYWIDWKLKHEDI